MGVERRPVHGLVACVAGPGGVAAAVTEASLMAYQHLVRAEYVPFGAAGGCCASLFLHMAAAFPLRLIRV